MSERGADRFERPAALDEKSEQLLNAYYDGELQGRALRRFEAKLQGSATLLKELELLRSLGDLARDLDADAATPDLWDQIALRLPAEDVRKAEEQGKASRGRWSWLTGGDGRVALARPLGAVAAAAVVALAIAQWWAVPEPGGFAQGGVVRWMDSGGRSVMVLEDDGTTGTTVIWLLDAGSSDGASLGGSHDVV